MSRQVPRLFRVRRSIEGKGGFSFPRTMDTMGLSASIPDTPSTRRERILRIVGYKPSPFLPLRDGRRSPKGKVGLATTGA
jgi:hypothetical protein